MKDYLKIETKLNENKEIAYKELLELGYTRYDINQFLSSGILERSQRGIYKYIVPSKEEKASTENVQGKEPVLEETAAPAEETPTKEPTAPTEEIPKEKRQPDACYKAVKKGISQIVKRNPEAAIAFFQKALEVDEKNEQARYGIHAAYVFQQNFEQATTTLLEFYQIHNENTLINNIYAELLLLSKLTNVDTSIIKEVEEKVSKHIPKKKNTLFKKIFICIQKEDYEEALRHINFSIKMDNERKKYHLTSKTLRCLIVSVLKKLEQEKNDVAPEETIVEHPEEVTPEVVQTSETATVEEPEVVVLIPETPVEETIKRNILLEAINQNDFANALQILENEEIENPTLVIQTLLSKLSSIQSLINTQAPIKVVSTEKVAVVPSSTLVETLLEEPTDVQEEKQEILEEGRTPSTEETLERGTPAEEPQEEVVSTEEVAEEEYSLQERIDRTYLAYKESYATEDFQEAKKNLDRYQYFNNMNGTHRNIQYHYKRIEASQKDYLQHPEEYIRKKLLLEKIKELKKIKAYKDALELIEEYRKLPGAIDVLLLITEAEIYFAQNNVKQACRILESMVDCEEPSYFFLFARIEFAMFRYQNAIEYCIAYNDRRPNQSPSIYKLMGDCYTKLSKHGKAIKAYRRAEELNQKYNNAVDLSSRIAQAENAAEAHREERLAKVPPKKI